MQKGIGEMNELALFAGAGGGILGGKLLGWRTVCAVEWEKYPACVLAARQNDGVLPPFPIWDDVQTFDGKPWRGIVDVVSGGFPCQDISIAGNGDGLDGERSGMWSQMARIISEVRPKYTFIENSPMLTSRGLERVLADLASMGFNAEWGVLGANEIGANHQRNRIWIVGKNANPEFLGCQKRPNEQGINGNRQTSSEFGDLCQTQSKEMANTNLCGHLHGQHEVNTTEGRFNALGEFRSSSSNVADTNSTQFQRNKRSNGILKSNAIIDGNNTHENLGDSKISGLSSCFEGQGERQPWGASIGSAQWWQVEPPLDRVANGMADRVDRLKAIGNGQVPLCAATAWNILNERLANRKYG
jgi:DNA (cytosine-5)-methyltransferase 1